ncbi:MAG: sel1 repeat family protein [Proteobacteria bacterium]|nr:sel1 repeat family protein [Pseudomonadota bacterium]
MMRILFLTIVFLLLSGCTETYRWAHGENVRSELKGAADKGDPEAEFQMGQAVCCGDGKKYSTKKAMEYFCDAAFKGHTGAQVWLGRMYENLMREENPPVPKNDLKAFMWYSVAAPKSGEAQELLRNITQAMTPKNLERAKQYAAHWRAVRCGPVEEPAGPWNPEWVEEQQEAAHQAALHAKDFSKNKIQPRSSPSDYPEMRNR